MRNRFFAAALAWIFLPIVCVVSTPTLTLAAHPIVTSDVKHDTSAPLRDMAASAQVSPGAATQAPVARPTGSPIVSSRPDPVAQRPTAPLSGVTTILNFDGQSAGPFVPPDTNGAVGSTQFLQIVNVTIAVYNKANGSLELGPTDINSIWKGFGGPCEAGNGGDPIVLFDQLANRWLVSQLQSNVNFTSNQQCIAVSTSSDATGTYHRYEFDFSENLPDYPKFGVWPDAYYNSSNTFVRGTRFIGAQACAFDRAAMLLGKTATKICFQNPPTVASLLPSDLDGHTLPPSGQPNFFVDIADATHLDIFQFHADFTNPLKSSFAGPTPIAVANFNEICNRAIVLACIPEPSPGEKVDGLGDRLMYRLAYSNFGGHESLVVNHTVHGGPLAGVRWYEIRSPGSSPFVFQQGTVVDPTTDVWMGSIAMDSAGDIALGFSASSKSLDPSILLVGRLPTDSPGTMAGPLSLVDGTGVQQASFHRWGDYSSMAIDPSDDCTFWYTQEYYKTTVPVPNWSTRITSFKFNSCSGF